jgi:hypothetical protein
MNAKLAQVRQVLEDIDFHVTGILGAANHPRVAAIRSLVRRGLNAIDDPGPRVHLLKEGVALCGFGACGVPGQIGIYLAALCDRHRDYAIRGLAWMAQANGLTTKELPTKLTAAFGLKAAPFDAPPH